MRVSVLMPYRYQNAWKETLFAYTYARLYSLWPHFEICYADCATPEWRRSAAINAAANKANGDMFLICDADTICNVGPLAKALRYANLENTWAFPYGTYYNLTAEATPAIIREAHNAEIQRPTEYDHALDYVVSGMLLVPRWAFEKVGGFDEEYVEWGFEDDDFAFRMRKLLGEPRRVEDGFVCHLWHSASEEDRFGQPYIHQNRKRFEALKRRG